MRARRACETFHLRRCSPALWATSDRNLLDRIAPRSAIRCTQSRSSLYAAPQLLVVTSSSPRCGPAAARVPVMPGPPQGLEIATAQRGRLGPVRRLRTPRPTDECHVGPRLTVERLV